MTSMSSLIMKKREKADVSVPHQTKGPDKKTPKGEGRKNRSKKQKGGHEDDGSHLRHVPYDYGKGKGKGKNAKKGAPKGGKTDTAATTYERAPPGGKPTTTPEHRPDTKKF